MSLLLLGLRDFLPLHLKQLEICAVLQGEGGKAVECSCRPKSSFAAILGGPGLLSLSIELVHGP